MTDRYWWNNDLSAEGDRLRLLEAIADPRSVRILESRGVGPGWRCAELGAGAGSMAAWLADRVGDTGSVLAVDRNLALLDHLTLRANVDLLACHVEDLDLTAGSLDLIHTRNLLMHVEGADDVLERLVAALAPGGVLVAEEADYYPVAGISSPAFGEVVRPLVSRWTWARTLPATVTRLGLADVEAEVDAPLLRGRSPEAAFWAATLASAEGRLTDPAAASDPAVDPVSRAAFDEVQRLLADESFWTPFAAVVCVSGRRA